MAKLRFSGPRLASPDTRRVKPPAKVADSLYSTPEYLAWRNEGHRLSGGYCQDPLCKTPERKCSRLFADHVKEIRDGGAPFDREIV